MTLRRSAAAVTAVALLAACQDVKQEAPPTEIVIAAYASPVIPTPNDLALQGAPLLPAGAQRALLEAFIAAEGFPSDQAVPLTIPFKRLTFDAATDRYVPATPPRIDLATVTASTLAVLKVDGGTVAPVGFELDADNCTTAVGGESWNLSIRRPKDPGTGSRAWAPGRYVFALRGGASGVRTTAGLAVAPDQAIALVLPNQPMTDPANQPPGFPPAMAAQLEGVRQALWAPLDWGNSGGLWTPAPAPGVTSALLAVDTVFPFREVASIATFEIAPSIPTAPVDSGSGIAPLPIDLLRTGPGGTIAYNDAFGAAAEGLTTLDGFSTTAMVLAPVTIPVDASTVHGGNVHLFKLGGSTPTLLKELKYELAAYGAGGDPTKAAYVAEPTPITVTQGSEVAPGVPCTAAGGCSLVVGLQPAVRAPTPAGTFYLPPLEEATDYAVVITTGVTDMLGRPLSKSTTAKILLDPGFDPIATSSVAGVSLLAGVPDDTATALQKMRMDLQPVIASLPGGRTAADVALAYTFRTQSIKGTALSIVGVPYLLETRVTGADFLTPTTVAVDYGISPGKLTTPAGIVEFAEVKLETVSWLLGSQNGGAFDPTHATIEEITALVAIPDPALVTGTCTSPVGAPPYDAGTKCAPLVVFGHGLGGSKAHMLIVAAGLASRGFFVAAIDAEKHGDRSYCTSDDQCWPGGYGQPASTCAFKPNLTTPVDVNDDGTPMQLGVCEASPGVRGAYLSYKVDCLENPFLMDTSGNLLCASPKGIAFASGNRLVSLNFFRIRDSIRQDVIDKSALVKALAPVRQGADPFAAHLAGLGIAVDYTKVHFLGHSYGGIIGAMSTAVNPSFKSAVFNASGATALDVFASPESRYHQDLVDLLAGASPPVLEGTPDYLKLLQIGKWILDPADPANFAASLTAGSLVSALGPTPPREVLTQLSLCDGTVPNAQNELFSALLGFTVPAPSDTSAGRVQWYAKSGAAVCPGDGVSHSNLIGLGGSSSLTQRAQQNAASFFLSPSNQATPVVP